MDKQIPASPVKVVKKLTADELARKILGDEEFDRQYAQQYASPLVQGANTIMALTNKGDELVYGSIAEELRIQAQAIRGGDMARIEDILIAQAHTLDRLFAQLVITGTRSEYLNNYKIKMDLALKAQRQCRATLETLALIKNPQPYVKQQNVAINQQVNNTDGMAPRAREKSKSTNELLEDQSHDPQRLDTRATPTASAIDTELEAVET